jgi:hypothetical protein
MVLPAILIGVGVAIPAVRWGELPGSRPGALLLPVLMGLIGLFQLARALWRLRDLRREPYMAEPYEGPLFAGVGWLRAKFGPIAGGLFIVAWGSALSVAFTQASIGATTWQAWPWAITSQTLLDLLGALGGAFVVALVGGLLIRHFDEGAVLVGGQRAMAKGLAKLVEEDERKGP